MIITPQALIATIRLNLTRQPLMHPVMVESILEIKRPQLMRLVESGGLPWAWDLGLGSVRFELRILSASVVERALGSPIPSVGATKNLKLPEVVNLIIPQVRQSLRGAELQRLFHITPKFVADLSLAGEISRISEHLPATGPNASPRFTRDSIVKLLEKRRRYDF